MDKWDPKWKNSGHANEDNYWAGAKKACDELGMSLPDSSKLQSLYEQSKKDLSLGLPTSGVFWSSSEFEYSTDGALYAHFSQGRMGICNKRLNLKVLCVGD